MKNRIFVIMKMFKGMCDIEEIAYIIRKQKHINVNERIIEDAKKMFKKQRMIDISIDEISKQETIEDEASFKKIFLKIKNRIISCEIEEQIKEEKRKAREVELSKIRLKIIRHMIMDRVRKEATRRGMDIIDNNTFNNICQSIYEDKSDGEIKIDKSMRGILNGIVDEEIKTHNQIKMFKGRQAKQKRISRIVVDTMKYRLICFLQNNSGRRDIISFIQAYNVSDATPFEFNGTSKNSWKDFLMKQELSEANEKIIEAMGSENIDFINKVQKKLNNGVKTKLQERCNDLDNISTETICAMFEEKIRSIGNEILEEWCKDQGIDMAKVNQYTQEEEMIDDKKMLDIIRGRIDKDRPDDLVEIQNTVAEIISKDDSAADKDSLENKIVPDKIIYGYGSEEQVDEEIIKSIVDETIAEWECKSKVTDTKRIVATIVQRIKSQKVTNTEIESVIEPSIKEMLREKIKSMNKDVDLIMKQIEKQKVENITTSLMHNSEHNSGSYTITMALLHAIQRNKITNDEELCNVVIREDHRYINFFLDVFRSNSPLYMDACNKVLRDYDYMDIESAKLIFDEIKKVKKEFRNKMNKERIIDAIRGVMQEYEIMKEIEGKLEARTSPCDNKILDAVRKDIREYEIVAALGRAKDEFIDKLPYFVVGSMIALKSGRTKIDMQEIEDYIKNKSPKYNGDYENVFQLGILGLQGKYKAGGYAMSYDKYFANRNLSALSNELDKILKQYSNEVELVQLLKKNHIRFNPRTQQSMKEMIDGMQRVYETLTNPQHKDAYALIQRKNVFDKDTIMIDGLDEQAINATKEKIKFYHALWMFFNEANKGTNITFAGNKNLDGVIGIHVDYVFENLVSLTNQWYAVHANSLLIKN